jgi:hypothetical protein
MKRTLLYDLNTQNMLAKHYPLTVLFICASCFAFAQEEAPTKLRGIEEIGLRLNSLENFDFIYKRALTADTYRRVRFTFAELGLVSANDVTVFSLGVGVAYGREKRVPLAEKLSFFHGLEPSLSLFVGANSGVSFQVSPGLGYVVGFQLRVSDRFVLGLEAIPSVSMSYTAVENGGGIFALNAGFSTGAVGLSGVYRFVRD